MALLRLAYISKSLLAGDPDERAHVADILMWSRRNNEEADVTGALLATDQGLAQVLEGPQDAVEATYGRITHDPRHQDVVLFMKDSIAERQFPNWSMAYINPSQPAEQAVARVTQTLPGTDKGEAARALVTFMSEMLATCGDGAPPRASPR